MLIAETPIVNDITKEAIKYNSNYAEYDILNGWEVNGERDPIVSGDFDGDGDKDFIMVGDKDSDNSGDIIFYENNITIVSLFKRSVFTEHQITNLPYPNYQQSYKVMISNDFNNDGVDDLFISNQSEHETGIYLNDGNGTSFTSQDLIEGQYFVKAKMADIDGDGHQDIIGITMKYQNSSNVWIETDNNKIWYLKNNGDGSSFTPIEIDQITETATSNGGALQITNADIEIFDIDNDSDLDLVISTTDASGDNDGILLVYENNGSSNFSQKLKLIDDETHNTHYNIEGSSILVTPVDYDNDGDTDFLHHSGEAQTILFENDGSGNFTTDKSPLGMRTTYAYRDFKVDVDHDGDDDIVVFGQGAGPFVKRNDGNGNWTDLDWSSDSISNKTLDIDYYNIFALFEDFNDDGLIDLITGDQTIANIAKMKYYQTLSKEYSFLRLNHISGSSVVKQLTTSNDVISWAIGNTLDANDFSISSDGLIYFDSPADFSNPQDTATGLVSASTDNVYEIRVQPTNNDGTSYVYPIITVQPFGVVSTPITSIDAKNEYKYALDILDYSKSAQMAPSQYMSFPSWLELDSGDWTESEVAADIGERAYVMAIDDNGNIYTRDQQGATIKKITPDGTVEDIITGIDTNSIGVDMVYYNNKLYLSVYGNSGYGSKVMVADLENPQNGLTEFLGGFTLPMGLVQKDGFLYIADKVTGNYKVEKVEIADTTNRIDYVSSLTSTPNDMIFVGSELYMICEDAKIYKYDGSTTSATAYNGAASSYITFSNSKFYIGGGVDYIREYDIDFSNPHDIVTGKPMYKPAFHNGVLFWESNNKIEKMDIGFYLVGTPENNNTGIHDVNFTLADNSGNLASHVFKIVVNNNNSLPTATDYNYTTDVTDAITFDWKTSTSATDSDGTISTATVKTQGSKGNAVINANDVTYTPDDNQTGSDSFVLTILDNEGGKIDVTITIDNIITINSNPTASDYNYTTTVTDAITFDWKTSTSATDSDGTISSATVKTQGSKGTAVINADDVTYTPNDNQTGSDSFVLTIVDNEGGEIDVTITIDNINTVNSNTSNTTNNTDTTTTINPNKKVDFNITIPTTATGGKKSFVINTIDTDTNTTDGGLNFDFNGDLNLTTTKSDDNTTFTIDTELTNEVNLSIVVNENGTTSNSVLFDDNKSFDIESLVTDINTSVEDNGTLIINNSNIKVQIEPTNKKISHVVTTGLVISKGTSKIPDTKTILNSDKVQTISQPQVYTKGTDIKIEAIIETLLNGETYTKFKTTNLSTNISIIQDTTDSSTPFESGNEAEIIEEDGLLKLKTRAKITKEIIF
jgi:hypothetical protein